jgi:hypothetical protein
MNSSSSKKIKQYFLYSRTQVTPPPVVGNL